MVGVFLRMYLVHTTYVLFCTRATVSLIWVKPTVILGAFDEVGSRVFSTVGRKLRPTVVGRGLAFLPGASPNRILWV